MTEPEDPGRRGPTRRSAAGSNAAVRGGILVGLAVILGIVLLNVVDDGSSGPVGDAQPSETTTTLDGDVTTTTGEAPPPTNAPSAIRVRVYNASAPLGAAATKSDELRPLGYQILSASDTTPRDNTVVYCTAAFAGDAEPLAAAVGGGAVVDNALDPLPAAAEEADCIVILGPPATDTTETTAAPAAAG
ncbi:MAG: LytR C-terminal domain-containing protein [Acidimicrobiia bacterium]|nr:LytR C-terminal domain-containing protein [Acidimicrobiia bacterium]